MNNCKTSQPHQNGFSNTTAISVNGDKKETSEAIVIRGEGLTVEQLVQIARHYRPVKLSDDADVQNRMAESIDIINDIVKANLPLYGVTTLFGGLGNRLVSATIAEELQNNLVRALKAGTGLTLPLDSIRGAMLLRANAHLIGASGIRRLWDERLVLFLNERVTPLVPEFGSIGASGDLIPLSYIASALSGHDETLHVDFRGEKINAPEALRRLDLRPERFNAKEGLALLNGTSMMAAISSIACYDLYTLMATILHVHAMVLQAMAASNQPFHPFLHKVKPHQGQINVAAITLDLIEGSQMIYNSLDGQLTKRSADALVQDRYSLRCIPQFLGPMIETMHDITRIVEIEINSANDNPLIDINTRKVYCGGNFLGEHIAIAMDRLRQTIGLMGKHLDVQVASLVTPEFNNGLPASLVGNKTREVNIGVKALQICGNSIMPYLLFLATPVADKFATHAEQYNQNINSLGHLSACLARQSIAALCQHLSICLLVCVQALDLRAVKMQQDKNNTEEYDTRQFLSPKTRPIYEAIRSIINVPIHGKRPYIWDDDEHALDQHIARLAESITTDETNPLFKALQPTIDELRSHRYSNHVQTLKKSA